MQATAEMRRAASTDAVATHLQSRGRLDAASLDRARRVAASSGEPVDRLITKLGLASDRDVAEALSELLELRLVEAAEYPDSPVLDERVGARFLREHGVLPIAEGPEGIDLAMVDPREPYPIDALSLLTGRPVRPLVAVPAELEAAIQRLYSAPALGDDVSGIQDDGLEMDVERLKDLASEAPVIRMVNQVIARAVEMGASDVHVEPFEDQLRIRYRVDGELQEAESPPLKLRAAILSRIKILSRLNIAERRLPQDGRIKLTVRGSPIDLRVSTMPSLHGETAVLRILDSQVGSFGFDALGLSERNHARLMDLLERPNGIVYVTGPTGSGKTTTLYAALRHLNTANRKILTAEDPVEYQIKGVVQIQVKPSIGLDFATVLRHILRQDPEVILVGETRDIETAQVSVQASLTGHLVLSSLHTNTAAAALTRLLDMGVEDYLLSSVLNGTVGQRLVRRLCPHCREPFRPIPEQVDRLGLHRFADGAEVVLHRPRGCERCRGRGYAGRVGLLEVMVMSPDIAQLAMRRATAAELQRQAVAEGMGTILEDGLAKAVAGVTTLEEVFKATRDA